MKPFRITLAAAAIAASALAVPAAAGAAIPLPQPAPGAARTPTAITAFHQYGPDGIQVTGTLTTTAGPVAGQTVTFTESTRVLCTAVTGPDGLAACDVTMRQVTQTRLDGGIFTARFAGTPTLAPTQRTGHI